MEESIRTGGGAAGGLSPEGKGFADSARAADALIPFAELPEDGAWEDEGKAPAGPGQRLTALLAEDRGLQSQFDRLVSKALATAQARWEREASLTAGEMAERKALERTKELEEREGALRVKELRAEALEALSERGVPVELIDCVSLADGEAMRRSLSRAEGAFRAAVDRAVRERLAGSPPSGGASPAAAYMAQLRAAAGVRGR